MEALEDIELKILFYLYHSGEAFTKKLASRLNADIGAIKTSIAKLLNEGYLERVAGTLVNYRIDRKNKVTKHRNHTYYALTRKGKLLMRNFRGELKVNILPPYKQV